MERALLDLVARVRLRLSGWFVRLKLCEDSANALASEDHCVSVRLGPQSQASAALTTEVERT